MRGMLTGCTLSMIIYSIQLQQEVAGPAISGGAMALRHDILFEASLKPSYH